MFASLPVRQVATNAFTLRKRYAQSIGHPPVRSLSQSSSQSVNHAVTLSIARSIRTARCTCQLEEIKMIWEKWKRRIHKRPSIETCRFVLLCLVPFAHFSFMSFPRYCTGNISGKLSGQSGQGNKPLCKMIFLFLSYVGCFLSVSLRFMSVFFSFVTRAPQNQVTLELSELPQSNNLLAHFPVKKIDESLSRLKSWQFNCHPCLTHFHSIYRYYYRTLHHFENIYDCFLPYRYFSVFPCVFFSRI